MSLGGRGEVTTGSTRDSGGLAAISKIVRRHDCVEFDTRACIRFGMYLR